MRLNLCVVIRKRISGDAPSVQTFFVNDLLGISCITDLTFSFIFDTLNATFDLTPSSMRIKVEWLMGISFSENSCMKIGE